MELEELKSQWDLLSKEIKSQKLLTDQLIIDMTQEKYTRKFSTLALIETMGALVCFIAAIAISVKFGSLDTWYLKASGLIVIGYLIVFPFMILSNLYKMKNLNIREGSIKETLLKYNRAKSSLLLLQRLGIAINFFILIIGFPVAIKLFKNKDFYKETVVQENWTVTVVFISITAILMIWVSRWGYRCYQKITKSAELTLKELEH